MFDRESDQDYINVRVQLIDVNSERHFIYLFSRAQSRDALIQASREIQKLNK